jgi:hypothetical protein
MTLDELGQRAAGDQRPVPVHDEENAFLLFYAFERHPHRVPGAILLLLQNGDNAWRQHRSYLVGLVPHDDQGILGPHGSSAAIT